MNKKFGILKVSVMINTVDQGRQVYRVGGINEFTEFKNARNKV